MQETYRLVTAKQLQIPDNSVLCPLHQAPSTYSFKEDTSVTGFLRSVSKKIFECNEPHLRIFVVQEL